jgi:predicted ester cyclase
MARDRHVGEDAVVTREQDRATVLRFFREVIAGGDLDVLDEIATADYEDHVALPGQPAGRAGLKRRIEVIRNAFEPRHVLHDVIVEDDLVAVHWTLSGTHAGAFLGLEATNRPIRFDGVDLYRMREGRMAAHWNVVDLLTFYGQIRANTHKEE